MEKINWKKDLKNFKIINAKILYILFYLEEKGFIKKEQKILLKKLAICYNQEILNCYKKFVDNNYNIDELTENLLKICSEKMDDDNISMLHRAARDAVTAFATPLRIAMDNSKKMKKNKK